MCIGDTVCPDSYYHGKEISMQRIRPLSGWLSLRLIDWIMQKSGIPLWNALSPAASIRSMLPLMMCAMDCVKSLKPRWIKQILFNFNETLGPKGCVLLCNTGSYNVTMLGRTEGSSQSFKLLKSHNQAKVTIAIKKPTQKKPLTHWVPHLVSINTLHHLRRDVIRSVSP